MEYRNLRRIDMGRNELAHLPSRLSDAHIAAGRQASETIRRLSAGVSSDLGKVRAVNEDNFLLIHLINEHSAPAVGHRCSQDLATDPWSCFAVFDGIGGLGNGELAAHSAAEIFRDIAAGLAPDSPHDEIDRKMRDGFSLAHQEVKRLRKAKCGTTGTMVCTNGRQFKVYHVGDCRAYLFRSGNLFQLTRDQTLSEMKMQRGIYRAGTPEQRSDSHVLTDYIGGTADFNLRPIESQWIPLRLGDKMLICSDGLYRLYRAGILTGNDEYGTFAPDTYITRASVAAIVGRIVEPNQRKHIELTPKPVRLVPMNQLQNLSSIRRKATDAQLAQAYEAARQIVEPLANLSKEAQLCGISLVLRIITENEVAYSMSAPHYDDPYGFFNLHAASCAGCTRATGLCLNMLGIPYEHVNENAYSHQWTRVNIDGTYWICDAYGLYCGPEKAPYQHPNIS